MIQLYQIPWSPYCLVQRRILEFGGIEHSLVPVPPSDRSQVWRLTKQRYYQVPIIRDGKNVLFETGDNTQVIAKYVDAKCRLGLFPPHLDGLQKIVWRYIENEVEDVTFRLNDIHYLEFVPRAEQCAYLRHKERKFGRGCLEFWAENEAGLMEELARRLLPFEQMLGDKPYLLDTRPRFADFDLWGMLANYLYSGHYRLPAAHVRLKRWHRRLSQITIQRCTREKLHSGHQRAAARSRLHS